MPGTKSLEKAYFKVTPDTVGGLSDTELTCRFNPSSVRQESAAEYSATVGKGYVEAPLIEFVGVKSSHLKMQLFIDGRETGSLDVSKDIDILVSWLQPTPNSVDEQKPAPPVVVFHWGKKSWFEAHLVSVSATYQMFDADGTPLVAKVDVDFESAHIEVKKQNPTSGSLEGRRVHVVLPGDSIHSIAFAEYSAARCWRGLAEANGIDDPLALRPGDELLIPPLDDVMARS